MSPVAPVLRSAHVRRPVEEAFEVFTAQLGAWWPLPTHSALGESSAGVAFEAGRLVERGVDGTELVWGEVLVWDPPHRLVMSWHPGRAPGATGEASEVEVRFLDQGADGTRVELEHRGWEHFGDSALLKRRGYVGPGAWGTVLEHFADVAETRADGVDLGVLEVAYADFFAEAERGGFGPAQAGEWGADEVLAHVALNDLAMVRVAHRLVHREEDLLFENVLCQDPALLAAEVSRCADLAERVARGRAVAAVAMAAVARLDEEQRSALVHCRLRHDGEVVLDAPLPWGQLAIDAQAARHLPAHLGQLGDLRA